MRHVMKGAQMLLLVSVMGGCVPGPTTGQPARDPAGQADACGAADLQGLLGQPESVLQTMRFTQTLRVIHPGTAVTMDYSPFRLNILIDARGRIERVSCG